MSDVTAAVEAVPAGWLSEPGRRFAIRLLEVNRDALQALDLT